MTAPTPVAPVSSERGDVPPIAVVTGGDSGIGRATAVALAHDGFDVGITYRGDEESAQGAAAEVREQGRRAAVRQMDLDELPARRPRPPRPAKAGIGLLTKVLALELGEYGVTVNAVAPGEIATPLTGQPDEDPRESPRPGAPLGRPGLAAEVAAVIAFLSSSGAAYVTGASHVVDGGVTLMGAQAGLSFPDDSWRRP